MQPLSDRTASFTDSVIRRMTRISLRYDAVNLSQGFPDFDPPARLLKSLEEISKDPSPRYHQYSITWGAQAMRQALAEKQSRYMGIPVDPDENIVVTCGSTEAMMAAMMTVTNPGDKVWLSLVPSTKTTVPIRFFRVQSLSMCRLILRNSILIAKC